MTGPERIELSEFRDEMRHVLAEFRDEMREELSPIRADIAGIKNEVAEWRGAKNLFKAVVGTIGFGGLIYILTAIATHPLTPS